MIDQSQPGFAGTALWDALLEGVSLMKEWQEHQRSRSIIFLTDWAANVGTLDPRLVIDYAQQQWVRVLTLGIGDPKGTELFTTDSSGKRKYFLDSKGVPIRADLDEKLLMDIAQATAWIYVNIQTLDHMVRASDILSSALDFGPHDRQSLRSQMVSTPLYRPWIFALFLTLTLLFSLRLRFVFLRLP
jgi:hypothetical protein